MKRLRAPIALLALAWATLGCEASPPDLRPSFLLVVIDTLRADAVSFSGGVTGTTPNIDALAASGLYYTGARSPAPWTLPSHASLFTGRDVGRHGVGWRGRVTLGDELPTLAERLRDAGYETFGLSENPLVSEAFGLGRGFGPLRSRSVQGLIADRRNPGTSGFDVVEKIARWSGSRDPERPFFAFANLLDPHEPYTVQNANAFLPAGVDAASAAAVEQAPNRICDALPSPRELEILRGLYLGDVAAADAKLGAILAHVRDAARPGGLIVVVTSDHGEHLGEHRLLGHAYTVREVALRIPLVVAGLPGVAPARIERAVSLVDVMPSILDWAGVAAPKRMDGRLLPLRAGDEPAPRSLVAAYGDRSSRPVTDWPDAARLPENSGRDRRVQCAEDAAVFGDLLAVTRHPFKLIRDARGQTRLFDLRWDPNERSDVAAVMPDALAEMQALLDERAMESGLFGAEEESPADLSESTREALRALGYAR